MPELVKHSVKGTAKYLQQSLILQSDPFSVEDMLY